jgi:hypothetical protein
MRAKTIAFKSIQQTFVVQAESKKASLPPAPATTEPSKPKRKLSKAGGEARNSRRHQSTLESGPGDSKNNASMPVRWVALPYYATPLILSSLSRIFVMDLLTSTMTRRAAIPPSQLWARETFGTLQGSPTDNRGNRA